MSVCAGHPPSSNPMEENEQRHRRKRHPHGPHVTRGSGTHTVRTRDLTGMTLVFLECFPRSYLPPIHRPQRLKAPFLSLPTSVTSFAQMAHTLSSPTPSSFSSSLLRSSCVPVASSC